MKRDEKLLLRDMLKYARKARKFTEGVEQEDYVKNEETRLLTETCIQRVGEAAYIIGAEYKVNHPNIPWAGIIGMRHRIVHEYWRIDKKLIWSVATKHVPELIGQLEKIVDEGGE